MNTVQQKWTIAIAISIVLLFTSIDLSAQQIFDAAGNAVVISNNVNTSNEVPENINSVKLKMEADKPAVNHKHSFRTFPQTVSVSQPDANQLPFENYKGIKDLAEAKRVFIDDLKIKYQNTPNKTGLFEPNTFAATLKQLEAMPTSGK